MNRPQVVKIGGKLASSLSLYIGTPEGCVLLLLLYSLYTYDCVSCDESTQILKFADDTTMLGFITNSDESEYLDEENKLIRWGSENNLELNINKTKEITADLGERNLPTSVHCVSLVLCTLQLSTKYVNTVLQEYCGQRIRILVGRG